MQNPDETPKYWRPTSDAPLDTRHNGSRTRRAHDLSPGSRSARAQGRPTPIAAVVRTESMHGDTAAELTSLERKQPPVTMGKPREQPDLVSSSPRYARRFADEWGRYLLWGQNHIVADCLPAEAGLCLLDAGGGHGQLLSIYAEKGILPTVFGSSEASFQLLDRDRIPCVAGDFLDLPFPDRSFDVVVSVRQISHFDNWRAALKELCRVARRSVVIDYPAFASLNLMSPLLVGVKRYLGRGTRNYRSFRNDEIRNELSRLGFRIASRRKEFLLPISIHRLFRAPAALRSMEKAFRATGLTDLAGNPTIVHAILHD